MTATHAAIVAVVAVAILVAVIGPAPVLCAGQLVLIALLASDGRRWKPPHHK